MAQVDVTTIERKMIEVNGERYIADIFCTGKDKYMCKAEKMDSGQIIGWVELNTFDPAFAFGEYIATLNI